MRIISILQAAAAIFSVVLGFKGCHGGAHECPEFTMVGGGCKASTSYDVWSRNYVCRTEEQQEALMECICKDEVFIPLTIALNTRANVIP